MSQDAAAGATRLIVAPWATLDDLPEDRPRAHDPDYEALLWQASEVLYGLTGRQWSGERTSTRRLDRVGERLCWCSIGGLAAAAWPAPRLLWAYFTNPGGRVLQLPDPPVVEVLTVLVDGDPVAVEAQLPVGLLRRADGAPWPDDGVEVTYRHGLAPPVGGHRAAIQLTLELGKAWAQDKSCRLPQRVQTIVREGVTVTFVDKFEALDQGRTGVYEIDLWITSVNPAKLTRRSRVWSPDIARRRSTST